MGKIVKTTKAAENGELDQNDASGPICEYDQNDQNGQSGRKSQSIGLVEVMKKSKRSNW